MGNITILEDTHDKLRGICDRWQQPQWYVVERLIEMALREEQLARKRKVYERKLRGEFLEWSKEYGGEGNEELAFSAGWEAAQKLAEACNSSHNTQSTQPCPIANFHTILPKVAAKYCCECGIKL